MKNHKAQMVYTNTLLILLLVNKINLSCCQRPIVNSSTAATSINVGSPSPSVLPTARPRSDIAHVFFRPGAQPLDSANDGTGIARNYSSTRFGRLNELKKHMHNNRTGYTNAVHDPVTLQKNSLEKVRKITAQADLTSDILEQKDTPNITYYQRRDPIALLKNRFYNDKINYWPMADNSEWDGELGVTCDFESKCMWEWNGNLTDGFQIMSGWNLTEANRTGMMPGPSMDGSNNALGNFLYLKITPNMTQRFLTSPAYSQTRENCYLDVLLHQSHMSYGSVKIVIVPQDQPNTSWVPAEIMGDNLNRWQMHVFKIGRVSKEFKILFEITPKLQSSESRGHIAIDNMRLVRCFPEGAISEKCNAQQVRCTSNKIAVCIKSNRICDIDRDCDQADDENLNCDKMPFGSRCDFEDGWCGWENTGRAMMEWFRHSGSTPTDKTGPENDHTLAMFDRRDGHYIFVNMNQHANDSEKAKLSGFTGFASNAVMNSQIFNPPPRVHTNETSPYRNSCMIRFFAHQFGNNPGSINLSVVEMRDKENSTITLWWNSKNLGDDWVRVEAIMPNITSRYYLQFEARMGMRIFSDVAIDDFSLSPECFGLNIPEEHIKGYNYWDPCCDTYKEPHKDFEKKKFLELTSCGARGRFGPTPKDCTESYNGTNTLKQVRISEKGPFAGSQVWKVPNEGYYTIIAKGAGGGLGSAGVGSSRGATIISVLELHKNEELYMLVGQPGEHACIKSIGKRDESCEPKNVTTPAGSKLQMVKSLNISDGSGGGGGASFVFLINRDNVIVPIVIAAGGGGLGVGSYSDDIQHGRGVDENADNRTGFVNDNKAGAGGGWLDRDDGTADNNMTGKSLLSGAAGGVACYSRGIHGYGGFGGGGGGCSKGGAGGGFAGGNSQSDSNNGEGGSSYMSLSRSHDTLSSVLAAANSGSGSIVIIPAIEGCGCDYRCVALDEYRSNVACICPQGWILNPNNFTSCESISGIPQPVDESMPWLVASFGFALAAVIVAFGCLIFMLYNRYQQKKQAKLRHKMLLEQDLQLSRLRNTPDNITSPSINIDYGCDGIISGSIDVKSLPQVIRERLRLIKGLGQGAFGEVYQGLYRHRDGDAVEMPVAIKTLPEMSTGQAESEFLMEAAIMAKFSHPNIVHLIGVCFDRHPRFIVLELLAGGDLKNFLRDGRSKPERPSPLSMKDLIFCALDVSKGCHYLEGKRFIHRDIAARNCLLSSKGPGRVVKIADFGMARDIYRSDYYRKGGKAMLPIKWMPPEAFLDGIFTSKTDVWSFGVLLWEVFSLGVMPYTGLSNRDVMQLVTGGGRLDSPPGCPQLIYRMMAECWNPSPELRPTFKNLQDRLHVLSQDSEIMNAPLPLVSIFRPVSSNERDTTVMRPPGHDDFCLQVPNSDYLIPIQGPRGTVERLLNEATGITLPESLSTMTAPISTTSDMGKNRSWETSFSIPKSTQSIERLQKESSTERLISLDTPQQTPTSMQPPTMSFGTTPLSSALNNNDHDSTSLNGGGGNSQVVIPNGPLTTTKSPPKIVQLDPSTLSIKQSNGGNNGGVGGGTSYANVKMMNANNLSDIQDKICSNNATNNIQAPFTIQGFNDRYNLPKNENHSEISC